MNKKDFFLFQILIIGVVTTMTSAIAQIAPPPPPPPATQQTTALGATQATVPASTTDSTAKSNDARSKYLEVGPYRFTIGVDEGDAFGAGLHGSHIYPLGWLTKPPPNNLNVERTYYTRYTDVQIDLDAGWSTKQDSLNNASLSIKPSIQWVISRSHVSTSNPGTPNSACNEALAQNNPGLIILTCGPGGFRAPEENLAVSLFGDFRYRYGNFKDGEVTNRINQFFGGGGAELYVPTAIRYTLFREWPRARVAYYTVLETSTPAASIPDGIRADHITFDASLKINLPFWGVSLEKSPLQLDASYRGSQPTTGQNKRYENFGEATLYYRTDGTRHPAVTFRSGKEQGLKYDKQVILGLLWELKP